MEAKLEPLETGLLKANFFRDGTQITLSKISAPLNIDLYMRWINLDCKSQAPYEVRELLPGCFSHRRLLLSIAPIGCTRVFIAIRCTAGAANGRWATGYC